MGNLSEKWKKVLGNVMLEAKKPDIEAAESQDPKPSEKPKLASKILEAKNLLTMQRPVSEISFSSVNEISSIADLPANLDEEGSLCNQFQLSKNSANIETKNAEVDNFRPPKIWISKSASMDDGIDEKPT